MKTVSADEFKKQYGEIAYSKLSNNSASSSGSLLGSILNPAKEAVSGLATLYGGGENGIARKLVSDIQAGAHDMQTDVAKGTAKAALRTAGDFAGAVYAPVGAAFQATGINKLFEKFANWYVDKFGKDFTNDPNIQNFVTAHPNLESDINRAMNIGMAGLDSGKIEPATAFERTRAQATQAVDTIKNTVSNTIDSAANQVTSGIDYKNPIKITPEKQAQAVDTLENDYYRWQGQTKTGMNKSVKTDARTEAMNNAGTTGKTPQRVLAESGIVPEISGTKFSTTEQATAFRNATRPLQDALSQGVMEVDFATPPIEIKVLESNAISSINRLNLPLGDKNAMIADVKSEFGLLREKYGQSMTASDLQSEKSNYWAGTKFDSTKPFKSDTYYQVAKSMQKGIEDMATQAGFTDVAQLNRVIGDRLEAAKLLDQLNGQTLKGGKIGKYALAITGATLGHGVVGKILGYMGGEMLGDILMRTDVANPVKRMILRSLEQTSPEAYQATLKWLEQQKALQSMRLALPSGDTGGVPNVINQGSPADTSSVKSVPAQKNPTSVNPKTGQFQKTYNSQY